ncbi:MAG TPA: hypothetical protein VGM10_18650 [Actinocrinis sp.]
MPEENESTTPAAGATEDKDAEAVLALQEIASEEPDVEAHAMAISTSSVCGNDYSCGAESL